MAARKDMTDSQKDLAAIVEEAAATGVSRGHGGRLVTPTPVRFPHPGDSSEMYDIAERVVSRNRPAEWVACEKDGPAARMGKRLDTMEDRMGQRMGRIENEQMDDRKDVDRIRAALDKFIGERDYKKWLFPLVTSFAASSLAAAVVSWLLRTHH